MNSFGMLVPNRFESVEDYKYGFQGQEKDDEIKGEGNSLNYTFRMHDPRAGRFFATDPLQSKYPHNSPFAFSENRVIDGVELEGREVILVGKQNSVGVVIGGSVEAGILIAPNGIYAYTSYGITLSTSASVQTGVSLTIFPTMPTAQDASGYGFTAGGGVGTVLGANVNINAAYSSGYMGINVIASIGAEGGFLGNFTGSAGGTYTDLMPLSSLAKGEVRKFLKVAQMQLKSEISDVKEEINSLKSQNKELDKRIEGINKELNTSKGDKKENLIEMKNEIYSNKSKNNQKITEKNKNLEVMEKQNSMISEELKK